MIIQAEAGNHLVKNQDNAVLRAKAAHLGQKALGRRHHAHIAGHRLHNQAGHLALVGRQQLRQGGGVIVRADQSFRQQAGRHAGAGGHALGQQAAAAFHQQAVAVAVIAALKLHQLAAAGATAGHTDGAHRGLRAGINHSQHFAGRVSLGNQLRQLHLVGGGKAVGGAAPGRLLHRLSYKLRRVAKNQRAVGANIVDITPPLNVRNIGPLRALHNHRLHAHRAKSPHRAVHTAGHQALGQLPNGGLVVIFIFRVWLAHCLTSCCCAARNVQANSLAK